MTSTLAAPVSKAPRPRSGEDAGKVLDALNALCDGLEPGAPLPHHTELMTTLVASERTVIWALGELQRRGRILRRRGAKTTVAEWPGVSVQGGRNGSHGLAQNLVASRSVAGTQSSTIVGLLKPDGYYFDRAASMLFDQVEDRGLALTCHYVDPQTGTLPAADNPLGYVLFSRIMLPWARQLQEAGHRVVLLGVPHPGELPGVPNVRGHHERGGFIATRHLLSLGHRRILFYGDDAAMADSLRWAGHREALAEAGRKGREIQDFQLTPAEFRGWHKHPESARAYFASPHAPTGIVTWNDKGACEMMAFLHYLGISIPEQISIVGYDALPEGEMAHPPLTTIDGAIEEQLRSVLEILTSPTPVSPHHSVVVLPTLVQRQSAAAPRA